MKTKSSLRLISRQRPHKSPRPQLSTKPAERRLSADFFALCLYPGMERRAPAASAA